MRVDSVNSGVRMKFPKGPFIFYEVGGLVGFGGGHQKKNGLEGGGHLKKVREKGGHVKYYVYWRGVVGKKLGGSCNFLMTLQKIPPAPPTS